jgi:predicted RNase H-like HicB family nuclease
MGYHWKESLEIGFTERRTMERQFKIIVEKHADGYVAYPLGLKGVVVGQGDTYEDALKDVKSAIRFHVETFGPDVLEQESPVIEAFVAEAGIAV